jgi:hypothetical protein
MQKVTLLNGTKARTSVRAMKSVKSTKPIPVDNYRYFSGRLFGDNTLNRQAAQTLRDILES